MNEQMQLMFYRVHDGCKAVWANRQEFRAFKVFPEAVVGSEKESEPITLVMVPGHLAAEMCSLSLRAVQLVHPPNDTKLVAGVDEARRGAKGGRPIPANKKGYPSRNKRPKVARRKKS